PRPRRPRPPPIPGSRKTRSGQAGGPNQDSADGRPVPQDCTTHPNATLNKVNMTKRKRQVAAPNPRGMVRGTVRRATLEDLGLLVSHRREMWKAIARIPKADLVAADRMYRRWARTQMKSNR